MKKKLIITSVSLPESCADIWRAHRREILKMSARYARICMRKGIKRGVTKQYNCTEEKYFIVTTRFLPDEYDFLHFLSSVLRVSVSYFIFGLISLWSKKNRSARSIRWKAIYRFRKKSWSTRTGILEEGLRLFRIKQQLHPPQYPCSSA